MNGIQSLISGPQAGPQQAPGQAPGQAQPPGQAPMPGMQPQQQGPQQAAQPLTPMLSQLGIPQLQALLMNPSSQVPKFALLTAIDKKIKEQQAMRAVQGMSAQQQAQQQQGTVADQILQMAQQQEQQPVMAAHGGMMRGYSGGGIVAFGNGGPLRFAVGSDEEGVQSGATSYPVLTPEELSVNERIKRFIDSLRMGGRETDERSVNERIKAVLPELPELPKRPSRADEREKGARSWQSAAPSEEVDLLGESLIPQPEEPDIGQAPRTAMLGKSGDPDVDVGQILPLSKRGKTGDPNIDVGPKVGLPAAAQLAGEAARQKPPARPGIASLVEEEIKRREGTRTLPPELVAAQERLAKAAERDVELRNEETRAARIAAEKARDEAMQRASGMSAEDYFNLAARLGGARKGEVVQRAAQGLGEAQARQRLGREAANKAFADFEKTEREANALTRKIEMQELQRQAAVEQGKVDRVLAIDKEIAGLRIDLDRTLNDRDVKLRELDISRAGVDARLADIASRERTEGEKLRQMAESTGQIQLANLLAAANGKVQSAQKTIEDSVKKKFAGIAQLIAMDPEKAKKSNPEQYRQYVEYVAKLNRTILEPAILERDRLQEQILGSSASYKPNSPTAPSGQVDPNNPLLK